MHEHPIRAALKRLNKTQTWLAREAAPKPELVQQLRIRLCEVCNGRRGLSKILGLAVFKVLSKHDEAFRIEDAFQNLAKKPTDPEKDPKRKRRAA